MFGLAKSKTHWNNIKDHYPNMNSEVIVFYLNRDDDIVPKYTVDVMHEKFIAEIDSPIIYWIEKPEIRIK